MVLWIYVRYHLHVLSSWPTSVGPNRSLRWTVMFFHHVLKSLMCRYDASAIDKSPIVANDFNWTTLYWTESRCLTSPFIQTRMSTLYQWCDPTRAWGDDPSSPVGFFVVDDEHFSAYISETVSSRASVIRRSEKSLGSFRHGHISDEVLEVRLRGSVIQGIEFFGMRC